VASRVAVRRLGPRDDSVVRRLATKAPPARAAELLADERVYFLVAEERGEPVGFVLAYELLRRHGDPSQLLVYEVDVDEAHRRRGVAAGLLRELARLAGAAGIREGWVLTERENRPAMALYKSVGGVRPQDCVLWEFDYAAG
jgi:ribosomal protein S18 acetylase RimI-like enzyme